MVEIKMGRKRTRCPKCGEYYNGTIHRCPPIWRPNTMKPPDDLVWDEDKIEIISVAKATGSAIEYSGWASEALDVSISSLSGLPPEYQENMNTAQVISEISAIKSQLSNLNNRFQQMENVFDEKGKQLLEKAKQERELFVPQTIWDGLPNEIKDIIESIRKSYKRGIPEFCPTLIRKALIAAIVIRFDMDDKKKKIYDTSGNPYGFPKMLELARQEGYISQYLLSQLKKELKVFGDIGAHDYKIKFVDEDVPPLFNLLRLALEQIFHETPS